jgi:hypothetical protein
LGVLTVLKKKKKEEEKDLRKRIWLVATRRRKKFVIIYTPPQPVKQKNKKTHARCTHATVIKLRQHTQQRNKVAHFLLDARVRAVL